MSHLIKQNIKMVIIFSINQVSVLFSSLFVPFSMQVQRHFMQGKTISPCQVQQTVHQGGGGRPKNSKQPKQAQRVNNIWYKLKILCDPPLFWRQKFFSLGHQKHNFQCSDGDKNSYIRYSGIGGHSKNNINTFRPNFDPVRTPRTWVLFIFHPN